MNEYVTEDVSVLKAFISLLLIFSLAGCSFNETADQPNQEKPSDSPNEKPVSPAPPNNEGSPATPAKPATPVSPDSNPTHQEIEINEFFPDENQIKFFDGKGNEFAQEKEIIFEMQGDYLPTIVSNGGTSMLKIYKLTDEGIYLAYQLPEYYEEQIPALSELEDEFTEVPILTKPVKSGEMINGWKIIDVDQILQLPIGTIKNAVILEQEAEDGSITRQYWAPKFGLVKKEFYMIDSKGTETSITTELSNITPRR